MKRTWQDHYGRTRKYPVTGLIGDMRWWLSVAVLTTACIVLALVLSR